MKAKRRKAGRPTRSAAPLDDHGSKARIQEVALKLFATQGYDGTTVQEIVTAAQTNLSMISYYFGGKEKLYSNCLRQAADFAIESTERVLATPQTREEFLLRLRLFMEEVIDFHIKHRDVATILNREAINPRPAVRDLFENGLFRSYKTFESFMEEAQRAKILRSQLSIPILSIFIFNSLVSICRNDSCASTITKQSIEDPVFQKDIVSFMTGDLLSGALED
jgi:AcrR family transcriptional regulator